MTDPKQPTLGSPESPEEHMDFPGEDDRAAVIDDTTDINAEENEIRRDDDAPLMGAEGNEGA
ncbi:MAG: hypothetical protein QOF01_3408 [Thermomicrobiales bacterium]|jgi:hypothetical protein|nr:hypothetical protein [Thermomicrobiales bacterium]